MIVCCVFRLDPTFVLRTPITTSMSFTCTLLKESPRATLATCCWGKWAIISHTHIHTLKEAQKPLQGCQTERLRTKCGPFPFKQLSGVFWKTSTLPVPLYSTLTIYSSLSLFSSPALHICLSYTKFLLNLLNGIGTRRTVPHGLSHSGNNWVVSPTKDGVEKCLSHLSTSSRRWTGKGDEITVLWIYRARHWVQQCFLRIRYESRDGFEKCCFVIFFEMLLLFLLFLKFFLK